MVKEFELESISFGPSPIPGHLEHGLIIPRGLRYGPVTSVNQSVLSEGIVGKLEYGPVERNLLGCGLWFHPSVKSGDLAVNVGPSGQGLELPDPLRIQRLPVQADVSKVVDDDL